MNSDERRAKDASYYRFFSFGLRRWADRLLIRQRERLVRMFLDDLHVTPEDTILDVGVSGDDHPSANMLERLAPNPAAITALGLGDGSSFRDAFPRVSYVCGDGCELPFADACFDFVYSHAVIEHVGSRERQVAFIGEAWRVAKRGVFITTPNRWHPMEFHTGIPLVHYLPARWYRWVYRRVGKGFYGEEGNLNLLGPSELRGVAGDASPSVASVQVSRIRFIYLPANLVCAVSHSLRLV
jgi:hypothetical protein